MNDWLDQYQELPFSKPKLDWNKVAQQEQPRELTFQGLDGPGRVILGEEGVQEIQLGQSHKQPQSPEVSEYKPPVSSRVNRGKILAVRSVSPGAGRTSLATNLAFEIASLGRSVCLVDLDQNFPTVHRYFGIANPKAAVLAGVRLLEQQRLTPSEFDQLKIRLVSKSVGVDLLAGFGLAQNWQALNWETAEQFLDFVAQRYQVVVVDAAWGIAQPSHQMLDRAAELSLWVSQPDAVSLGRFIDGQPELNSITVSGQRAVVINRVRASVLGARPDWQIQQLLKNRTSLQLATLIPQDDSFDQAMLQGLPLRQVSAKSKAVTALSQLAKRLG